MKSRQRQGSEGTGTTRDDLGHQGDLAMSGDTSGGHTLGGRDD